MTTSGVFYGENSAFFFFCIALHGEAKIINVDIRHVFIEILKRDALFSTIKRLQKYDHKNTFLIKMS
jgi:hypothetical protein